MAIAAIPHGKCSRAAGTGQGRVIFPASELAEGVTAALPILNGVMRARGNPLMRFQEFAARRIYNKSALVAQSYIDRARNSVGHGARFSFGLSG